MQVNIHDKIYYVSRSGEQVLKATIADIDGDILTLTENYIVDTNGVPVLKIPGSFNAVGTDHLYPSADKAFLAMKEQSEKRIQHFCEEIKTIQDLIQFPLNHCIGHGEEYTDYDAQTAYKKRAADFGYIIP